MKTTKQLKTLLAVVLLALLLPQWAAAYDFMVDGLCYNRNSDGTSVTVTYQNSSVPRYPDLEGDLAIPEVVTNNGTTYSVTSIGESAFGSCSGLTSVTIPNSVTSIGESAFGSCSGLTSVNISDIAAWCGIHFGGSYANPLYYAHNLYLNGQLVQDLTIPNSVTSIGNYAFEYCSGLTGELTIPNSVTSIGNYAFRGCSSLTSVDIPNSVTSIGNYAFRGCSGLTSVDIPNSVTSIGDGAFYRCSGLTGDLTIPNSVTSIGNYAFQTCSRLTSVTIPNSVTSIGESAFESCSGLRSVTIGNSVISIGASAFYSIDNKSLNRTLTLCGGVETIGSNAFGTYYSSYRNVATLILKDEVVNIKNLGVDPTQIYTYASTPPECDNNTFKSYNATLHVPASAMAAYYTAPYWQNFANIVGDAVEPTSLTLSADTAYVKLGSQLNLQATLQPSNTGQSIAWSTSDASIATVNNNGVVNALQPGECDITVTCADLMARCHVVVLEQQITITLDHHELEMDPSTLQWLTPSFDPISTDITASCSNSDVVLIKVINNRVQVLAVQPGRAVVTVRSADGKAVPDSCVVIVRGVQAESITLDQTQAEVTEGNVLQLTATILPEGTTNKGVTWTSSNEQVAIVNEFGAVAALSPGTAVITAATQDGSNLSATCQVTVKRKTYLASSVTLDHETAELDEGETLQLTATVLPENATVKAVAWSSSDEAVATVNEDGLVTAIAAGTATISAATVDGSNLTATCQVTVSSAIMLGDANGDGEVTVTDVVLSAQKAVGKDPSPFVAENADVNGDGEINITDVVLTANIAVGKPLNLAKAPGAETAAADFLTAVPQSEAAGTHTWAIALDNTSTFTAFQMRLALPDGCDLVEARLSDRAGGHALLANKTEDGISLLGFTPDNAAISDHSGTLLLLTLGGADTEQAQLQDVLFVEPDGTTRQLAGLILGDGVATGVRDVYSDTRIFAQGGNLVIETGEGGVAQVILPNGMSRQVEVMPGRNVLPLERNIYIVRMGGKVGKVRIQ